MPNFYHFSLLQAQLMNLFSAQDTATRVVDTTARWGFTNTQSVKIASETPKFWLIEDLWQSLRDLGIGPKFADLFAFIAACLVLFALIWVIDRVITKISLAAIKRYSEKTKSKIDDRLVHHKFFHRLFHLLPDRKSVV